MQSSTFFNYISILSLLFFIVHPVSGFRWTLDNRLDVNYPIRVTEGYVYSKSQGPPLLNEKDSYIDLDLQFLSYASNNRTQPHLRALVYRTDEDHKSQEIPGICDSDQHKIKTIDYISNVQLIKIKNEFQYCGDISDPEMSIKGNYCVYSGLLRFHYSIEREGWYNIILTSCDNTYNTLSDNRLLDETHRALIEVTPSIKTQTILSSSSSCYLSILQPIFDLFTSPAESKAILNSRQLIGDYSFSTTKLSGTVSFRNPYGFLPGELYGLLPFESGRVFCYLIILAFYSLTLMFNQESVVLLHAGLYFVLILATIESIFWCATYFSLNSTGQPYCCPYPPLVITSLMLQVFRQTLERSVLLIVCLGYGIVRPKLLVLEWIAISIISVGYFLACLFAETYFIVLVSQDFSLSTLQSADSTRIPVFIIDVIFVTWIYLALTSTIRILKEFQQTIKLKMYERLLYLMGFFATLFLIVTIAFLLDDYDVLNIPWQITWLQQALWETLNFVVLAGLVITCRPTENSRYLAYATQLPTEDPDEDDEMVDNIMFRNHSLSDDDEDDKNHSQRRNNSNSNSKQLSSYEMVGFDRFHKGKSRYMQINQELNSRSHGQAFSSLPNASDEHDEEYGIDDD